MRRQQSKAEDIDAKCLKQLDDILLRYGIDLPLDTVALLTILKKLDNPYELMAFLEDLSLAIISEYDDKIANLVIPEITAVHAQLPMPSLANLSYNKLDKALKSSPASHNLSDNESPYCQASLDMQTMLEYIRKNSPVLTKTLKQLNRKSVAAINALLVEPQQTVHDYGDVVFTDRNEHNVWKVSFLRSVAQSCHMTYIRKGRLHVTKHGIAWLNLDDTAKANSLFRTWCEDSDWGFWRDWDKEIADRLHFELLMLYQVILAMDTFYGKIEVSKLDTVCETLCEIISEPDEYGSTPLRFKSYFLVIRPFMYMGLAIHKQKSIKSEYDLPKDVSLTSYGKWLLNTALREEWSWTKARSICPECQKIHPQ